MKTRYKISLVIASFVVFYFALIPALHWCTESDANCSIYQELVLLTRPVISGVDIWNDDNGIGEWNGTPQGIEIPTVNDYLRMNQNFILSMIILPCGIIGAIVVWDKRK